MKGYYFITDSALSKSGIMSDVKNAIAAGCRVFQYRNKTGTTLEMYQEAKEFVHLVGHRMSIVNDRVDIAVAVDSDGIHIGQDDLPYDEVRKLIGMGKIIGVTVSNIAQAQEAERFGADYLGISPIFTTTTKENAGEPVGIELIKQIRKVCKIPIVAIGGITLENAPTVIQAGAEMVSAISAVVTKDDVKAEICKFQTLFNL